MLTISYRPVACRSFIDRASKPRRASVGYSPSIFQCSSNFPSLPREVKPSINFYQNSAIRFLPQVLTRTPLPRFHTISITHPPSLDHLARPPNPPSSPPAIFPMENISSITSGGTNITHNFTNLFTNASPQLCVRSILRIVQRDLL